MPVDVCNVLMENKSAMAAIVEPPAGFGHPGKNYYMMKEDNTGSKRKILFEVDTKYAPIKAIGRGSYGVVCSSNNHETNEKVAIKKISNVFGNEINALRTLRELMLLRCIKHQNVVALKDVMKPVHARSFKDVYLVYELMDTDLHRIIQSRQILSNEHCKYFLFQILRGLEYLHSANILHRDLKPGNLLVNLNCELKICDFGLARTSSKGNGEFMTQYVVTRWYRAPELLLSCDNYGASIDVWSVGCILAEILGGEPIFPGTNTLSQLKLIMSVLGEQHEEDLEFIDKEEEKRLVRKSNFFAGRPFSALYPHADPLALDLLRRMLIFDPSKRITVAEALRHPYFSGMYDGKSNPPPPLPVEVDIDERMSEAMMREMMLREILYYHPEETPLVAMNECSNGSGPKSWLSTPVNNIVTC